MQKKKCKTLKTKIKQMNKRTDQESSNKKAINVNKLQQLQILRQEIEQYYSNDMNLTVKNNNEAMCFVQHVPSVAQDLAEISDSMNIQDPVQISTTINLQVPTLMDVQVPICEEGDYLNVLFHMENGSEWVIGIIRIICNEYFWVDSWSDGDNTVKRISKLVDEWKMSIAEEYIPPKQIIQKKNTTQDPNLPTIGETIYVDFCTSKEDQTYSSFSGVIKIIRDKHWFVKFSDGEVQKIKKSTKWTKK